MSEGKAMDAETERALRESIEHWRRMATGARINDEQVSGHHCALCKMFVLERSRCVGCPVMLSTGLSMCENTPFGKAYIAADKYGYDSEQFKAAALVELEFLEGLLP